MGTHPTPDVVIVGAGIAGLTAAWYLTREGRTVTLVDPAPGSGASWAAAGMIAAVSEVMYQHTAMRTLMAESAAMYPDFVAAVERAVGHPVGFRATATLDVGATPADCETFARLAEVQRASGMHVERLTSRQARSREPALTPSLSGAFLVAADHQVNPRVLVPSLIEAVTADGGSRVVRQRVTRVLYDGDARVVTGVVCGDGSAVRAGTTLLCPGVSLDSIAGVPGVADVHLRPVHGDILRTRLRPGQPPLLTHTVRGLVNGNPVYLVPRTDGEIVIGATEREDNFDGVAVDGVHRLLRDARTLVPGVEDLELTEILARPRPGTPDDLPYLGRPSGIRGLVVSTGYSRHGVLLAPLGGRLAADLVLGTVPSPEDATVLDLTSLERTTSWAAAAH